MRHPVLRELEPLLGRGVSEPSPAEAHAPRALHVIRQRQRAGDLLHHDVDPWIQTPARHDRRVHLGRGEESLLAGSRSHPLVVHQPFALGAKGVAEDSVCDGLIRADKVGVDGPRSCYQRVLVLLEMGQVALQLHHLIDDELLSDSRRGATISRLWAPHVIGPGDPATLFICALSIALQRNLHHSVAERVIIDGGGTSSHSQHYAVESCCFRDFLAELEVGLGKARS
mmetsp:Transcript_55978/g.131824  ORF Transcript_55978/g.131824 Transcript_55978/m.131824 type:complete len:227 (+) Transcript_55978:1233-1913(+)